MYMCMNMRKYPPAGDSDWVLCVCEKKKSGWGVVAQWWGAPAPQTPRNVSRQSGGLRSD